MASSVPLQNWSSDAGKPDRSLTRLRFQGPETHRAAQVELMEVQSGENHTTLSAQLHNEKSSPLLAWT